MNYLFALRYFSLGDNDDFAVLLKLNDLGDTVWVARMVDVACQSTSQRCIDNHTVGNTEHVDPMILYTEMHTLSELIGPVPNDNKDDSSRLLFTILPYCFVRLEQ